MYMITGYDDLCMDINIKVESFMEAIQIIRKLRDTCIVWLTRESKTPGKYVPTKYSTAWV
jgi:hypothetical protein